MSSCYFQKQQMRPTLYPHFSRDMIYLLRRVVSSVDGSRPRNEMNFTDDGEPKVAHFWCSTHILTHFAQVVKERFGTERLARSPLVVDGNECRFEASSLWTNDPRLFEPPLEKPTLPPVALR